MKEYVLIEFTEHDLELFKELVYIDGMPDIVWELESEMSGNQVQITFTQAKERYEQQTDSSE